ncbi:MAG: hypothetical protein ACRD15_00055, partial [Vicinamibacterales bacterium]
TLARAIAEEYRGKNGIEPLVLVGHSYGADDVVRIARKLDEADVSVDLLVTLDPVTPPAVPKNVKLAYNLYQSNGVMDAMPWLRGVRLEKGDGNTNTLMNVNIRTDRTDLLEPGTDHFNIEKKDKIHDEVIATVLKVCPDRPQWVAMQKAKRPAAGPTLGKAMPVTTAPVVRRPAAPATKPVASGQDFRMATDTD